MLEGWDEVLVQRFVDGREVNVGILGDAVLPIAEIDFGKMPRGRWRIVTYQSKWVPGSVDDIGGAPRCPAKLPAKVADEVRRVALRAWKLAGGSGYGRVDMRIDDDGQPWILEVNANPDIAPDAGLARMAKVVGIDYAALIRNICELGLGRVRETASTEDWILAQRLSGVEVMTRTGARSLRRRAGVICTSASARSRKDIATVFERYSTQRRSSATRKSHVALELFDETFAAGPARAPYDPGDGVANYEFVGSFSREGQLVGYVCYGATPGTDRTYDLYWIAMHPECQGEGGGSQLLDEVERRLIQREARMLVVETSSRDDYRPTRRFYEKHGYVREATSDGLLLRRRPSRRLHQASHAVSSATAVCCRNSF